MAFTTFPAGTPPQKTQIEIELQKKMPRGKIRRSLENFSEGNLFAVITVHRTFHSDNLNQKRKNNETADSNYASPPFAIH